MTAVILVACLLAVLAAGAIVYPGPIPDIDNIDELPGLDAIRAAEAAELAEAQRFSARADAQGLGDDAPGSAPVAEVTA